MGFSTREAAETILEKAHNDIELISSIITDDKMFNAIIDEMMQDRETEETINSNIKMIAVTLQKKSIENAKEYFIEMAKRYNPDSKQFCIKY